MGGTGANEVRGGKKREEEGKDRTKPEAEAADNEKGSRG